MNPGGHHRRAQFERAQEGRLAGHQRALLLRRRHAQQNGKPILADPKGTDYTRYTGFDVVTPNRRELEAAAGTAAGTDAEIVHAGTKVLNEIRGAALLITRGKDGMTLLRGERPAVHIPATAREVYDVTGAGDTVIRGVGDILKRSVRRFDLCTRFGGEEFAIVMPGSGAENSASVAERIRQRIETFRPAEAELTDLRVTASIGMAVSPGASARELIARADQALYEAKRGGKNRLVEWKPPDRHDTKNTRNPR